MRPALVGGQGMDLIDDDRARGLKHGAARLGAEKDIKRFRRRYDDMRRPATHAAAFAGERVAGAHERSDLDVWQSQRAQLGAYAGQGDGEVAFDVVGKRLQRGDVDDVGLVRQSAGNA